MTHDDRAGGDMGYAVVIEAGPTSVGAFVPDLPGCVAVRDTVAEVRQLIGEAIAFHLDGMRAGGLPIPPPSMSVDDGEP